MLRTVRLVDGKYEFDILDGQMVAARRDGEEWPLGLEWRFSTAAMAALGRIVELEEADLDDRTKPTNLVEALQKIRDVVLARRPEMGSYSLDSEKSRTRIQVSQRGHINIEMWPEDASGPLVR